MKAGSTPAASIALRPRLGWTVIRVNFPAEAEWTQARRPATRNPVSSKCATGAAVTARRIVSSAGPSAPVTRRVMAVTVSGARVTPNSSARTWPVRSRDRKCPCHRYVPIAVSRGPYCTGAVTPAGAAAPVTVPQPQRREMSWCSVTTGRAGGTSVTCRRITPASPAPARLSPHAGHCSGSCAITSSGAAVNSSVAPGCPFGRPGLRPLLPRSDRVGGLAGPSCDGGFEEFREFCPTRARSSATSAASAVTCPRSTSSCA